MGPVTVDHATDEIWEVLRYPVMQCTRLAQLYELWFTWRNWGHYCDYLAHMQSSIDRYFSGLINAMKSFTY